MAPGHRPVIVAFAAVILAGTLAGGLLVLTLPARSRGLAAGSATIVIGLGGVGLGLLVLTSGLAVYRVGWLIPLSGATFAGDATSGLFVTITGAVAVAAGLFTVGYHRRSPMPTGALACLPLFVAAMLAVPLAGSVTTFLFGWELMALTSLVLVLADHRHQPARAAGQLYAVMTQLGFAAILLGLVIFLGASGGGDGFARLAARAAGLSAPVRTAVFLLTFAGFGSKAGLLPLHAWLPRAHPEAPSPVSALMSASMVNLGIYGIIRFDLTLLGPGPRWWGLLLLGVGAVTAVYAVLQATVATDVKRLLAYSTSENMGLVTLALGAAVLLRASHNPLIAEVAMAAALLHVINHAAFKSLGFLSAGAVLAATGVRDLDRLGGLARRMPVTTTAFALAALGGSGLPLGAGFVSEWLLLQSLIHTRPASGTTLALVMPFAVGAVALTTGLGVAAMVKAFGIGFLARPRSPAAAVADEVSTGMRVAMALPAACCLVLAIAPVVLAPALRDVLRVLPTAGSGPGPSLGLLLRLPGISGSLSPTVLALAFASAVAVAVLMGSVGGRRRPPRRPAELWASGGGPLTARMEYTATSFAEPLQRVFADVLRPDTDIEINHLAESQYLVEQVRYRSQIVDAIELRLHTPVIRAVAGAAQLVRRCHRGNVHLYLGYGALGLLIVLVLAR
jgi:hydrogenase-4 component B